MNTDLNDRIVFNKLSGHSEYLLSDFPPDPPSGWEIDAVLFNEDIGIQVALMSGHLPSDPSKPVTVISIGFWLLGMRSFFTSKFLFPYLLPNEILGKNTEGESVIYGALYAYEKIREDLWHELSHITNPVYVVGRTFGSFVAQIALMDLRPDKPETKPSVSLVQGHLFGAPPVGNEEFASLLNASSLPISRTNYKNDIFTSIPNEENGYYAVGELYTLVNSSPDINCSPWWQRATDNYTNLLQEQALHLSSKKPMVAFDGKDLHVFSADADNNEVQLPEIDFDRKTAYLLARMASNTYNYFEDTPRDLPEGWEELDFITYTSDWDKWPVFIALLTASKDTVVLAFRGSVTSEEFWSIDAHTDSEKPSWLDEGWGTIHGGFLELYDKIRDDVNKLVTSIDFGNRDFYLTGHSLGGALATLCMVDLHVHKALKPILYTYGSPVVGTAERFVHEFNAELSSDYIRIVKHGGIYVNYDDIVTTRLPYYEHVGQYYRLEGVHAESEFSNHSMKNYVHFLKD